MPESVTTGDVRAALTATLDRVETRLLEIAHVARINALLSIADPAFVLPSPSVGLMEIRAAATTRPENDLRLRSRESYGPTGDVILTLVDQQFVSQPWRVKNASWIERPSGSQSTSQVTEERLVDGVRVELVRSEDSIALPSRLSLYVNGGRIADWGLQNAVCVWKDRSLPSCHGDICVADGVDGWELERPLNHHLLALSSCLFHVELPAEACHLRQLSLEIRFADSIPVRVLPSQPEVEANVTVVWNSLPHRYPEFSSIGQATSETPNTTLHQLTTFDLGDRWLPWSVTNVGGQNATGRPQHLSDARGGDPGTLGGYSLVFLPADDAAVGNDGFPATVAGSRPRLAILLTPEARRRLDRDRRGVTVSFRATSGSLANGIPAGTEFETLDPDGLSRHGTMTGCLLTPTFGGCDGFTAFEAEQSSIERVHALLPAGRCRSIGDVMHVLEQCFANVIEIVDARDFLRLPPEPLTEPLLVRVRMKQQRLSATARRAILKSCESFLRGYLLGSHCGHITLVPFEVEDNDHGPRS